VNDIKKGKGEENGEHTLSLKVLENEKVKRGNYA
jgi:hypothetical protein